MRSRRTVGAWVLVVSVLVAWCLAAVAAWAGLTPSIGDPEDGVRLGTSADLPTEDLQVVLVGVPGLTWDLVSAEETPHLVRLAQGGGSAALVLRGTHEVTCEADAWLTVGAGQRAATDLMGCGDAEGSAGADASSTITTAVTDGRIDEQRWQDWQEAAAGRALGPQLGTLANLAEAGGSCVAAYGPAAVIGAAGEDAAAAVAIPAESMLDETTSADVSALSALDIAASDMGRAMAGDGLCRIHLVSGPQVHPGDRSGVLADVDAAVGRLAASLSEGTTLLVAGMGQFAVTSPQAQVLVAAPIGAHPGAAALTSGSTRQAELVQLTDLTPTLLSLAGVEVPATAPVAGQPVAAWPSFAGPDDVPAGEDAIGPAADLAAGITWVKNVAPWVLGVLVIAALGLLGLGGGLLRWSGQRARVRGAGRTLVLGVASFAMAGPVATWLAGLFPWWRAGQPMVALLGSIVLWALLIAAVAWAGPWRRHPLGPPAVISAITLVVIYVDILWSARLGLVSVLGLQPITAGRFFGQGNVGLGIILGASLVLMAAVLTWLSDRPRQAAAAVALVGLGATVLNGAPTAGADFGGVPALVVATGLLVLHALGIRWTWRSLLGVAVAGGLAAAALMVLDWLRGPEQRTHLGGFVQSVLEGEAWGIVTRKLAQSVGILLGYPIAWLVVLLLVLLVIVLARRPAWSERIWRHSGTYPAVLAGVPAMVLAWVLNDSGLPAMGACLAVLIAAGLAVLGRGPTGHAESPDRARRKVRTDTPS